MTDKIAFRLTRLLLDNKIISSSDTTIYQYGFEVLLCNIITISTLIVTAFLFHIPDYGILYLMITVPLKVTAGGYHADTFSNCPILSHISFLLTAFSSYLLFYLPLYFQFMMVILCCLYILSNAPVRNKHHPVKESIIRKNRKRLHYLLLIYFLVYTILVFFHIFPQYYPLYLCSIASIAFDIILTKKETLP